MSILKFILKGKIYWILLVFSLLLSIWGMAKISEVASEKQPIIIYNNNDKM